MNSKQKIILLVYACRNVIEKLVIGMIQCLWNFLREKDVCGGTHKLFAFVSPPRSYISRTRPRAEPEFRYEGRKGAGSQCSQMLRNTR